MADVLHLQGMEQQKDDKLPEIADSSVSASQRPASTSTEEKKDHVTLPDIQKREIDSSTESIVRALGLAGTDERSLGRLLKTVRGQVLSTLDELRTITTHDDNLERQYKEMASENVQLNSALEKARGEIRHLKGKLSVLQMTAPDIRKFRARGQLRERRKIAHERQLQQSRQKYGEQLMPVLNVAERARTVNARGEYIDHRCKEHMIQPHFRHSTYPPPPMRPRTDPLPPPLLGCRCSVCHAQQSLGAYTVGRGPVSQQQQLLPQQPHPPTHLTKSGQQILLGDRVIVKGERPGMVRYIGRMETDIQGHLYIGVHLVMPVGTCDGSLRGRQYFQCPPYHGVFVKPSEVMCVTGRKPCTGGTVVPRIQEKVSFGPETSRKSSKQSPLHWGMQEKELFTPTPTSSPRTASTMTQAHTLLQQELIRANTVSPSELYDASVQEMSRRMKDLARKNKLKQLTQLTQEDKTSQETISRQPSVSPPPQGDGASHPDTPPTTSPLPTELQETVTPDPPSVQRTPTPPRVPLPSSPPPPPPPVTTITPSPTPEPRAETPLQTTLLQALETKDLGNTGFVTGNELSTTLAELSKGKAMSENEIEILLEELGISRTESGGFPYVDIIPYLVQSKALGNETTQTTVSL